jgi:hypothetical protein
MRTTRGEATMSDWLMKASKGRSRIKCVKPAGSGTVKTVHKINSFSAWDERLEPFGKRRKEFGEAESP